MNKVIHDSETPARGQQVHSACAFIHHDFEGVTKVCLLKRAATKKFLPGLYELPGGHIELYEDLRDGLRREIKEELGKDVTLGDPFSAFTYENQIKGSHTIEVIFFATFMGPIVDIVLNPEDHSDYDWFSEEDAIERRAEIVPTEHVTHTHEDDPEYLTILKGFKLLRGERLTVGETS
jgi:8-oxo-dGTP diphosphatase